MELRFHCLMLQLHHSLREDRGIALVPLCLWISLIHRDLPGSWVMCSLLNISVFTIGIIIWLDLARLKNHELNQIIINKCTERVQGTHPAQSICWSGQTIPKDGTSIRSPWN